MREDGDGYFFPTQEEHAVYSLRTNGQGFEMTSAAQAPAGRTDAKKTDHAINRQRDTSGSGLQNDSAGSVQIGHRTQGRPPRTASETGLQRIVDAMRAALRQRQNIHVTRKEIAKYAGVTPALVTYYFPERDDLIEAVTIPIVTAMATAVQNSLNGMGDPRQRLLKAIDVLIESYAADAATVDLFVAYRASNADRLPDLIGGMEAALVLFFNQWLHHDPDSIYDAVYLQKATIGMCKIVARRDRAESSQEVLPGPRQMTRAEAICAMLLGPMPASGAPASGPGHEPASAAQEPDPRAGRVEAPTPSR